MGAGYPPFAPRTNHHPSWSFCRGSASSPCSPVCWASVTCPHWATWTGDALGTPSRPGSLAPQSCSGRHRGREGAFALSIVPALCPLSGGCRACGLGETTKELITTRPTLAAEKKEKSRSLGLGAEALASGASAGGLRGRQEREARKSPSGDEVSVQVAPGSHACPRT